MHVCKIPWPHPPAPSSPAAPLQVRFLCSESQPPHYIASIKEAPTCHYTVTFHTSILCSHSLFRKEAQPWNMIDCYALPPQPVDSLGTSGDRSPQEGEAPASKEEQVRDDQTVDERRQVEGHDASPSDEEAEGAQTAEL
eukprot:jgi/Mesen1/264/ME1145127C09483